MAWKFLSRVLCFGYLFVSLVYVTIYLQEWGHDKDGAPLLYAIQREIVDRQLPPLDIVLCAKVADESMYLLEWIEFHRLQGVDKFALYPAYLPGETRSTGSTLSVELVKALYDERGMNTLIDLHPTYGLLPDEGPTFFLHLNRTPTFLHRTQQHAMLSHCSEKYRRRADFLMHIDVDEFVYADFENATLLEWLRGRRRRTNKLQKIVEAIDPFRQVGYYIYPTHVGNGPRLFDFHTQLVLDLVGGKTQVYFDPRDSTRFQRIFRKLRSPSAISLSRYYIDTKSGLSEKLAGHYGGSEDVRFALMFQSQVFKFIADLRRSFAINDQELVRRLWIENFRELYKLNDTLPLVVGSPASEELEAALQLLRARTLPKTAHLLTPHSIFGNVRERQDMADRIENLWADFFPLITEEQRVTQALPSEWTAEEMSLLKSWMLCGRSEKCSKWPPWMTQSGKAIYITAAMSRSTRSRRGNLRRGCLRPWVHECSHAIDDGILKPVRYGDGLRLDHHQFRSVERRTTLLPNWRGGPLGYAAHPEYVNLLKALSVQSSDHKANLSIAVRKSIFQLFRPIPKFFEYRLHSHALTVLPSRILSNCSPLELLRELQVPCPQSHPYVGFGATGLPPPHSFLPYHWCTTVDLLAMNESQSSEKSATKRAVSDRNLWHESLQARFNWTTTELLENIVLCPGWPESRCCSSATAGDISYFLSDFTSDQFYFLPLLDQ